MAEGTTLTVDTSYLLTGDGARITSVGNASNGTVTLDGTTVTYRHDGSETLTGGFTYTVADGTQTMTLLVTITVIPVNDPPIGVTDALAVQETETVSVQAQQLLANDSDAEGDTLSITAVGDATKGLVTLDGTMITYRHDGSETNTGSFTYTVTDGTDSTTALVTIAVNPVNDPPVGVDDALAVQEGDTVSTASQQLLANDTDVERDGLTITAVGDATNGLVTLDGNTITYRHDGSETTSGQLRLHRHRRYRHHYRTGHDRRQPGQRPAHRRRRCARRRRGRHRVLRVSAAAGERLRRGGDTLSITVVGDASNGLVTLDGNTIIYGTTAPRRRQVASLHRHPTVPTRPQSWSRSPSARSTTRP